MKMDIPSAAEFPQNSRYANALRGDDAVKRLMTGDWPMQWAQTWRFVSDDPGKVTMKKKDPEASAAKRKKKKSQTSATDSTASRD